MLPGMKELLDGWGMYVDKRRFEDSVLGNYRECGGRGIKEEGHGVGNCGRRGGALVSAA